MLPWLVIPLIGLWAVSQLLPPGFRFEITSPRLACVLVLLVTLFWYEVLMPQLSAWRARRSARLRERRRFEAFELQKLRKAATRRCRNCHTPYRDQNPGGGRFMCAYCGHVSKRPVLDIPGPMVLGISNSGMGKIWKGKVWLESAWICGQDWPESGHWPPGYGVKSGYLGRNGSSLSGGGSEDRCLMDKSYFGGVAHSYRMLSMFLLGVRWLWANVFRLESAQVNGSNDADNEGMLAKKGENGNNFHESRGEKARRKAEEKRQARMERELLDEEERKQREEVARLVEERRRLRDEQLGADKDRGKDLAPERERDGRRETERRGQERRRDTDRGSSKSNSDLEDLERKSTKESERKRESDRRHEIERKDFQKTTGESMRVPNPDVGHSNRNSINGFNRLSGGSTRYFDRVNLYPSKAFNGAGFFGRATHNMGNAVLKMNKSTAFGDHVQPSVNRREVHSNEHVAGKITANGNDRVTQIASNQSAESDEHARPVIQKKSWQQLFTHSSTTTTSSGARSFHLDQSHLLGTQSPQLPDLAPLSNNVDNQMHFVPVSHSDYSLYNGSENSGGVISMADSNCHHVGGPALDLVCEEAECFEDPCYRPDPWSLLGPVSESLDNFSLDLGSRFISSSTGQDGSNVFRNSSTADVSKPAPIESPFSRSRVAEVRHASGQSPNSQGHHNSPMNDTSTIPEHVTWQMWGTPPLGQEGLGLAMGPGSWLLTLGQKKTINAETLSHEITSSPVSMEKQFLSGKFTPEKDYPGVVGQTSPFGSVSYNVAWSPKTAFQPLPSGGESPFSPHKFQKDLPQNDVTCDSSSKPAAVHPFEPSPANCWSKRVWATLEGDSNVSNSTLVMPHIGGLFTGPDVQSLWLLN